MEFAPPPTEGDGNSGGCLDDAHLTFGASHIAKAQLYTCGRHDTFDLSWVANDNFGGVPSVKIVFTFTNENVGTEEVRTTDDTIHNKNARIPLME